MIHPDFEYNEAKDNFTCKVCGADVARGIISVSGHWAECSGKGFTEQIKKIDAMPLATKDKIDLVKGVFNLNQ